MFCLLIFLAFTSAFSALLPIRTGIAQLQQGVITTAQYTLQFKSSLTDPNYNSLVSVSYVQNFDAANSIDLRSSCPNLTQTGMGCTVQSSNTNQNSIIYISYVVSDIGSLLVGTFTKTFSFGASTKISQSLVFTPQNLDNNLINTGNSLFVNIHPYVSGISSLDNDFTLTIDSQAFDASTLTISLGVSLSEVHVKEITVVFGYLLYDSSAITISLFEGQKLIPGKVQQGYVYGIKSITTAAPNPKRLLQAQPLEYYPTQTNIVSCVSSVDASNIQPSIEPYPKSIVLPLIDKKQYIPETTSQAVTLIRDGNTSNVQFQPVSLNSDLYATIMQSDGIVDTNSSILQVLREIGFFKKKNQNQVLPTPSEGPFSFQPQALEQSSKKVAQSAPLSGIDNQLFNNLFATNGFVILTEAADIDQIYFYEIDPVRNIPSPLPSPLPSPPTNSNAYYRSVVSNVQLDVPCKGVKVGILSQIDYIQKKMVQKCIECIPGTYFDLKTKSCLPLRLRDCHYAA